MTAISTDYDFHCLEDPPRVFITWNGVQVIEIIEEPIYLGGVWDDESSWELGPLAKLIYKLTVSAMIDFSNVVEAQPIRGIPNNNIPVPEGVRIRLERDCLPSQLPPIRYELGTTIESTDDSNG